MVLLIEIGVETGLGRDEYSIFNREQEGRLGEPYGIVYEDSENVEPGMNEGLTWSCLGRGELGHKKHIFLESLCFI